MPSMKTLSSEGDVVVTTTQRNAMTGLIAGTRIWNSTTLQQEVYNGTTWDPASLKAVVTAGSIGSGSDIPILDVDAQGRIISKTSAGVVAKSFGALWGQMHSYGAGPTGAGDAFGSFWRRWASALGIPARQRNVYTRGGMAVIEPRADDTNIGIGDVFVHGSPPHMYGIPGNTAPKTGSQSMPGVDMILEGLNDAVSYGTELFNTLGSNGLTAFKHGMRAMMAVRRAAQVYGVDASEVAFGGSGWSAVKTDKPYITNRRYKESGTADDYVELTLKPTYKGEPVFVEILGCPGFSSKLLTAITTTTQTTVQIDNTNAPKSGTFEVVIDSERILVTANASTGTQTLNTVGGVSGRGQGGTTAATHLLNAVVKAPLDTTHFICSGSTASCSSQVSVGAQDSSGRTYVAGQGSGGRDIHMIQRFTGLSVLDAGKKIRITLKTPTGTTGGLNMLRFVSFKIEDNDPNTMLVINQPKINVGFAEPYIISFNTAMSDLVAEVSNAYVVDVATEISDRFGATFVGASGTGATFHIKPNNASRCEIDIGTVWRSEGEEGRIDGGASAGVAIDKTNPNDWLVHTDRAYTGTDSAIAPAVSTAAASHGNTVSLYDTRWMREDRIHPGDKGDEIYAEMLFASTNAAPATSAHLAHSGMSTEESRKQGWYNGGALYRRGARANRTLAQSKEWAASIEIPADGIITYFTVLVRTAGATGALLRIGRYSDGNGFPGYLLYDTGASYGPGTVSGNVVGVDTLVTITPTIYIPVKRGRNWFSLCCQGAAIGTNGVRGVNFTDSENLIPSNPANQLSANEPQGVSRTGVTGALSDWLPINQYAESTGADGFTYGYETGAVPLVFVGFEAHRSDI